MATFRRVLFFVAVVLAVELWCIVTLSALHDLKGSAPRPVTGVSECSILTNELPQPRLSVPTPSSGLNQSLLSLLVTNLEPRQFSQENDLLQAVFATLRPHLPKYAQSLEYTFVTFDSPTMNAFSLSGGYVLVQTGLFTYDAPLDYVAYLVAHEVAHIFLQHTTHRDTMLLLLEKEIRILIEAKHQHERDGQGTGELDALLKLRLEEFGRMIFKRDQNVLELEADLFAAHIASRAGYDMNAAALVHARMAAERNEQRGIVDISSHPPSKMRELVLRCADGTLKPHHALRGQLAKIRGRHITKLSLARE